MLLKHGKGLDILRPCDSVEILPNSYENTVLLYKKLVFISFTRYMGNSFKSVTQKQI